MYCPQCGTESASGQHYCRSCGSNLKVIGRAVTLSEAVSRSDRGPAKIKEIMKGLKVEQVTEDISRALDRMNKEIVRGARGSWNYGRRLGAARQKTPEQRRERHIVKGTISLFSGAGLTVFLYYLAHALVLKLPPDVVASIPFEIDPVVHVLWLIGLIPALSGVGHIVAGLSIRPGPARQPELPEQPQPKISEESAPGGQDSEGLKVPLRGETPASITERTTNILERAVWEGQPKNKF
jgi:hypothetical protein